MTRNIRITPFGGLGNRMFQYMFALALQRRVPDAVISGTRLPEWGVKQEPAPVQPSAERIRIRKHDVPFHTVVQRLRKNTDIDVDVERLNLRMEYYAEMLDTFRSVFPPGDAEGAGAHEIVLNVRADEILSGIHRNFIPIPISFYERIVAESGLEPVLVGQIGDDDYSGALCARFPRARVVNHGSTLGDFHYIRASESIVVAISSYSWLAAWLSESAKRIYMPVAGLYHRGARPDCDLLPRGDPRYTFFQSDLMEWKGEPELLEQLMHAPPETFGFRRGATPGFWLGMKDSPQRTLECWLRRHVLALQAGAKR